MGTFRAQTFAAVRVDSGWKGRVSAALRSEPIQWRRRELNPRKVPFEPVVALNLTARIRRG
jgi:hypothetical protein